MLKNLLIAILTALSTSLIIENPRVCAQLAPCTLLQGYLRNHEAQQQQQVESIMSRIRLMQGSASPAEQP